MSLASSPTISPSYVLCFNYNIQVASFVLENWFCENKALICRICSFLWCKYSHHSWFYVINNLTTSLQNSWIFNHQLLRAGSSWLQHSSIPNTFTFWNASGPYMACLSVLPDQFNHCRAMVMSSTFGFTWTSIQISALEISHMVLGKVLNFSIVPVLSHL